MWWWLLVACAPVLEDDTPYLTDPRLVAAQVEPPEAAAGDPVRVIGLYADASGALSEAPIEWSLCVARRPLDELGPVDPSCLEPGSSDLVAIGTGLDVPATLPPDACSLFGPDPPPPAAGESGRPVDPDVTGGYYQPIVGLDGAAATLVSARLRCGLPDVRQETYIEWNQRYVSNANPRIDALGLLRDGAIEPVPADGHGTPPTVAPGEYVLLAAAWQTCDAAPCDGAEPYVVYDRPNDTFVDHREAISVTWFGTGGTFDLPRTGVPGDAPATTVSNGWTAPDAPGEAWFAVVIRDDRGGVGFTGFRVTVAGP